jgi:hypothetical protein
VTAAAIDGHGVLYAGTWTLGPEDMPLPVPGDWLQSVDGGATWRAIASVNAGAGPIGFVTAIAADIDGRVYLGTGADGIWQATGRLPTTLPPR